MEDNDGTIRPRPKRRRVEFVEELEEAANLDRTAGVLTPSSFVHMRRTSSCSSTSSTSSNANVDLEDEEDKFVQIGKSTYEFNCPDSDRKKKVKKKMRPQEEESSILNREIEEFFTRTTKEQLKLFQKN
ncbi:uncharacterized protein LOC124922382 isoform X2 [Impatiens glandulifera]|uniref:uncharacterized protein LOC124922382 isoform X2 n=1 Tax=Impatiens glandulifera TaxID=253017 RepID=UPI001FB0A595|nr:uncharacterized protein LOC124922382 isoform X2 [Impatiens glandulifera]